MAEDLEADPKDALRGVEAAVVVFYAPWCKDCKASEEFEARLSGDFAGKVSFYRLDAVNLEGIADKYGIERYPTWIFFVKGKAQRFPLVEPVAEGEARNWLEMRLSYSRRR